jgi:hypothetical protein
MLLDILTLSRCLKLARSVFLILPLLVGVTTMCLLDAAFALRFFINKELKGALAKKPQR